MSGDVFKGKISEDFYKNTVNDGRYDDIIGMPHHVSKDRPHMSQADRAAQFAPFAALTGHGEAVRRTQEKVKLAIDNEIEHDEEPDYVERELLPDE